MKKVLFFVICIILNFACNSKYSAIKYGIVSDQCSLLLKYNNEVWPVSSNRWRLVPVGEWEENDSLVRFYYLSIYDSLKSVEMANSVSDTTRKTVIYVKRNNYDSPLFFIHILDQHKNKISELHLVFDSIGTMIVHYNKNECRFLVIGSLYSPIDTIQAHLRDSLYIDLNYRRDIIKKDYFLMEKNKYYMKKMYGIKWFIPLNTKYKIMKKYDYKLPYINDDI